MLNEHEPCIMSIMSKSWTRYSVDHQDVEQIKHRMPTRKVNTNEIADHRFFPFVAIASYQEFCLLDWQFKKA